MHFPTKLWVLHFFNIINLIQSQVCMVLFSLLQSTTSIQSMSSRYTIQKHCISYSYQYYWIPKLFNRILKEFAVKMVVSLRVVLNVSVHFHNVWVGNSVSVSSVCEVGLGIQWRAPVGTALQEPWESSVTSHQILLLDHVCLEVSILIFVFIVWQKFYEPGQQGWHIGYSPYRPYRQNRYISIGNHSCRYISADMQYR